MFEKDQLGVFDWILFFVLMSIPFVNLIFGIVLLAGGNTNQTLKNYLWAGIVMGVFAIFMVLTVLAPMFSQLIDLIQSNM